MSSFTLFSLFSDANKLFSKQTRSSLTILIQRHSSNVPQPTMSDFDSRQFLSLEKVCEDILNESSIISCIYLMLASA